MSCTHIDRIEKNLLMELGKIYVIIERGLRDSELDKFHMGLRYNLMENIDFHPK